jgi:hypothetical protein
MRTAKLLCAPVTNGGVTSYTNINFWSDDKITQKYGGIYLGINPDDGRLWYWNAPESQVAAPPPTEYKDMTDAQVAADPLFPLIQRATKALRTFGPTSKRPANLDLTDKGFMYVDSTLNTAIWWYGTLWRDSAGVVK